MDESQGEYAKSKTPVTKCHTVYDSFYMKCSEKAHLCTSESRLVVASIWEWEQGVTANELKVTFWGDGSVPKVTVQLYSYQKSLNCTFKTKL